MHDLGRLLAYDMHPEYLQILLAEQQLEKSVEVADDPVAIRILSPRIRVSPSVAGILWPSVLDRVARSRTV